MIQACKRGVTALQRRNSAREVHDDGQVSAQLTPPGQRNLVNFQNLFGLALRL